jgi:cold shock CspA family protein
MGKSQETFSKKEREKKKLRKRQDKDLKREERKANSDKGKPLEEMMAYIDENGNISDTPPDPKKKKIFLAEDIQYSVAKQAPRDAADNLHKGKITHFNHDKGYGFIQDSENGESVFVHINSIEGAVQENVLVVFEIEKTPRGLSAVNVKIAPPAAPIAPAAPTVEHSVDTTEE